MYTGGGYGRNTMKTITLLTKPVPINQKYFVVRGRMLLSTKYRDAKEAMMWEIKSAMGNFSPLTGSVELNIMFYHGDKRKHDIDNCLKILLDAMSGIIYEDDSQIDAMHIYKEVDKKNPRTIIQVL